ncbi:hypothetical protein EYF80_020658 [Liparis tanakae]|uniref:Uncharacterized protein n=1 Tax=Liparis tanakae TaxID=230148 RepID=A0A4Z2HUV2_9TELE|nr:hypothetical protein EYF80_020658 [Liparis tanakae]
MGNRPSLLPNGPASFFVPPTPRADLIGPVSFAMPSARDPGCGEKFPVGGRKSLQEDGRETGSESLVLSYRGAPAALHITVRPEPAALTHSEFCP